jgi:hypothetical protein
VKRPDNFPNREKHQLKSVKRLSQGDVYKKRPSHRHTLDRDGYRNTLYGVYKPLALRVHEERRQKHWRKTGFVPEKCSNSKR